MMKPAGMMSGPWRAMAAAIVLGGCVAAPPTVTNLSLRTFGDPGTYSFLPGPGESGDSFRIDGDTRDGAIAEAERRLIAAGLGPVQVDRAGGVLSGQVSGPALVNCGEITPSLALGTAPFDAAAALAIFPVLQDARPVLVRREADIRSGYEVTVTPVAGGGYAATVQENHAMQVRIRPPAGDEMFWEDRFMFTGDEPSSLTDGNVTRCQSARVVRAALAQAAP